MQSAERLALGVLYADEQVLVVGRDHDLVFLRSDAQEGEVVRWVDVANDRTRLRSQLVYQSRVLHRRAVVHRRADRDACTQHSRHSIHKV